jgi:hypothetical protein
MLMTKFRWTATSGKNTSFSYEYRGVKSFEGHEHSGELSCPQDLAKVAL